MSQQSLAGGFTLVENKSQFITDFIKSCNGDSDEGYFFEKGDAQYPKKLHDLYNDLPFLPQRLKIEKVEKLVVNFDNKKEYVMHIRNLKQALNHELILKKVHIAIKANQEK